MPGTAYNKAATIGSARGDGTPDATAMASINALTLRDLAADEVYVREAIIAHNGIDRDRETISDALLDGFASSLPGKGFFVSHPGGWSGQGGPGEGRWFAARTERMSLDQARIELGMPSLKFPDDVHTAVVLKGSFYLPRKTASELIDRIDAGVARDVSIQFTAKRTDEKRDEDGRLVYRRLDAPGEALEASLVWLGAQPGARVTKYATPHSDDEDTAVSDELKNKLKAAETARDEAQAEAISAKAQATQYAALRKALGDDASVLDDAEGTAALIRAGKSHRESLLDSIIAAERARGLIAGDDEASVKGARDAYAPLSTDKLAALAKRYADADAKAGNDKSAIAGGDPNAAAPNNPSQAAKPGEGSFLDNPAITGASA